MHHTVLLLSLLMISFICSCGGEAKNNAKGDSTSVDGSDGVELPANLERTDEPLTFSYALEKGEAFGYSITTTERVTITRDSLEENSTQIVTYRYKFEVLDVASDGEAVLQATCLGVEFDGQYKDVRGSRKMEYDSDKPNDASKEKMYARYNAMVNIPFEITLASTGKITSVNKLDAVMKKLLGEDYATIAHEAKTKLTSDFGNQVLKSTIQWAFQNFEPRPISVDSSWTMKWTGELGYLKLEHIATYTLKGISKTPMEENAHIVISMTSKYIGEKRMDTGQGMATVNAFDVKGSGTTTFDMRRRRSKARKLKQQIYVKFFVEMPEEVKQLAPDQAKDFWLVQKASIENVIAPLSLNGK